MPFPGITADTLAFVIQKNANNKDNIVQIAEYSKHELQVNQSEILYKDAYKFEFFANVEEERLISAVSQRPNVVPLSEVCMSTSGFGGKSELIFDKQVSPKQRPRLKGDSIGRYRLLKTYWFEFRKENITGRTTDQRKLAAAPKILLRKTGSSIIATYDESSVFPEQSLYFLYDALTELSMKYVLGILNSRMMNFYFRAKSLTNKNSIAQVKKVDLDQLPIRNIKFELSDDKLKHDKMVALVEKMLTLQYSLAIRSSQDRTLIQRQISAVDHEIDLLVYKLYGLTEAEIKTLDAQK